MSKIARVEIFQVDWCRKRCIGFQEQVTNHSKLLR